MQKSARKLSTRNKWVLGLMLGFTSLSLYAGEVSELVREYFRRNAVIFSREESKVLEYLKSAHFSVEKIEELEIINTNNSFLVRSSDGLLCLGNANVPALQCYSPLGLPFFTQEGEMDIAFEGNQEEAYMEYTRRSTLELSRDQQKVVRFLRTIRYDVQQIVELEALESLGSFVLRDIENNVCFGNSPGLSFQCHNKRGLVTFSYQGDSD